jgi:hypothetical protein
LVKIGTRKEAYELSNIVNELCSLLLATSLFS